MANVLDKQPRHAVTYRAKNGLVQWKPKMSFITGARGEYRGMCLACAAEAHGVEPDARGFLCEECGAEKVYGLEQLVLMNLVHFDV